VGGDGSGDRKEVGMGVVSDYNDVAYPSGKGEGWGGGGGRRKRPVKQEQGLGNQEQALGRARDRSPRDAHSHFDTHFSPRLHTYFAFE
jgi:hypothetical protein